MILEGNEKFDTIMIIDDNTIDLYISSRIITKNKFAKKLLQFSSAVEALDYLNENQENKSLLPNLILVDIHMPIMSGFEFMEIYNQLSTELKSNCDVYIISSTINDEDLKKIHNDKNIIAFHEKPITKEFLDDINGMPIHISSRKASKFYKI
ncbi:MAG: response regulator [Bacteroidota bacterium]